MPYLTPSVLLRNKDLISPVSIIVLVVVVENENGNVMVRNHYLHKRGIVSEILTWYILVIWNESLLSYCPCVTGHMVRMVDTKLAYRILRETCRVCSYPKSWEMSYDQFLKPFSVITPHITRVYYCHVLSVWETNSPACGCFFKQSYKYQASFLWCGHQNIALSTLLPILLVQNHKVTGLGRSLSDLQPSSSWNSSSVNLIILHTVLWHVSTFFLGLESSSISPYMVKLFTITQEIITTRIHRGFGMLAV